jgi:PAS domain S-box-containing protein
MNEATSYTEPSIPRPVKPQHRLRPAVVVLAFGFLLGAFSLLLVAQHWPDSLLILFAIPVVLAPLFSYGRGVYLSMVALLAADAVWVTAILSNNFRASLLTITFSISSSVIMAEIIHWLFKLRLRAETQLRESEGRYRQLFELGSDALFLIDNETGQILEVNVAASALYGYSKEELLRIKNTDLSAEPDQTRRATVEGWTQVPVRYHRRKDGTVFPVEITGQHFTWQGRQVHIAAIRDITQRLEAEQMLQEAEWEKRMILDSLSEHVVYHDLEHRIIWVNEAGADSVGRAREELIGRYCYRIWPQSAQRCPDCPVAVAMETGKPYAIEKGTPDGRQWFIRGYPVRDQERDIIGGIEVTEDITERKQTEARIAHLNAVLRAIRNVNQLITRERDPDRLVQGACNSLIETRGYHSAWLALTDESGGLVAAAGAGLGDSSSTDLLQRDQLPRCIEQALAQADLLAIEAGSMLCSECPLSPENKETGTLAIRLEYGDKVYGVLSVSLPADLAADKDEQDLFTEVAGDIAYALYGIEQAQKREQAESQRDATIQALSQEVDVNATMAELAKAFLTSSSIGEISNFVLDDARALTGSQIGYTGYIDQLTGWLVCPTMGGQNASTPQGSNVVLKEFDGLWGQALNRCQPVLDNNPVGGPLPMALPADHTPIRKLLCVPVLADGNPVGQITLANAEDDYTERDLALVQRLADLYAIAIQRQRLEEQLVQSQKMEAIGRLAGGIAHDFNNNLTAITGYSELILEALSQDDAMRADVEAIARAAESSASLTRQLLAFSRKQILEPRVLNLNRVVTGMQDMLQRLIGENIHLQLDLTPSLGTVRVDPGQIEQVIMNLAVNACDAIREKVPPAGGQLTIRTAQAGADEIRAPYGPLIQPGIYATLSVIDDGVGMDHETQSHLFEPFFTTKGEGKGTGLGLAMVYGIVKQSGGHVFADSEPGQGSTFTVCLPQIEAPSVSERAQAPDVRSLQGTETVLLVEDEDSVRALARRALERRGYTVIEAGDGTEALDLCQEHKETIHLLLTDVVMPGGVDGRTLAEQVARYWPGMKVLYMSGYTDEVIAHHGVLDPGVQLIEKPFGPDALARKVRDVLEAR